MTCWGDDEPDPPSDRPKVRGCTDVFWLAIYVAFWFLMIMIAGFALAYGNPRRLVNGYDSFGNTCGAEYNEKIGNFSLTGLNMTAKKFLFFFNMANVGQSMDICVEKCPDRDLLTLDDLRSFYKETGSKLCRYDFDLLGKNKDTHGLNESLLVSSAYGPCPLLPVNKSTPVMNRCVPTTIVEPVKHIVHGVFDLLNSWDFVEQVLGDLYATWPYILAMTFFALFLSLIVISLFYLFANIVSFIIMTVVCIASLVGCTTVWWTYYEIKVELDNTPSELLLEEAIQNERAFFIYGIISSVITAVILLLVCSMRRNLNFLADLFKEAAECLSALPSLYLQPILSFVQLLVFYWFWVLVVVCLATANYPGVKSVHPFSSDMDPTLVATSLGQRISAADEGTLGLLNPVSNISIHRHKTFTLVQYVDATWVRYMWWVYLISLVWTSEFILSCQQMVVAGAVARWYFNGWKKTTKSPVLTSFRHMICYHLGTMAKGSLLITIFKLPRLILTYLHTKFKKSEDVSSCARCGLKSCICCFWCLESFIRYINHNAYTVVAMQGINFCPAAARAFHVLMSNAIQFAIINSMGDFILFLGKVIVTAITGSVGLLLIKSNEHLYFYSAPTLVICVFAYFIAHSVISLYEIVIDTLFLCVCEDQNMNGEAGRWRERTLSSIRSSNGSSSSRMVPELKPMNA